MDAVTFPFWKNRVVIPCEKDQFLDVLEKSIEPAPSLQSNMPQMKISPDQLSGTVEGDAVYLTAGRVRNWLDSMILRGTVVERNETECEIRYRFIPCIPFCFTIAIVNYWIIDIRARGEDLIYMLMILMLINCVFLCISFSQCGRIQRLLNKIIREASSPQTTEDSCES